LDDKAAYSEWVFVYLPSTNGGPGGTGAGGAPPGAGQ
jgi:hypothetical protein